MNDSLKTFNGYKEALSNELILLKDIPFKFVNKEMCEVAVIANNKNLLFVPRYLLTPKLIKLTILNHKENILCVRHQSVSIITIYKIIKDDPMLLKYIPESLKAKTVCYKAFENDIRAIEFIPVEFITRDMAIKAVEKDPLLLSKIPGSIWTEELLIVALSGMRSNNHACNSRQ